MRGLAGVLLQLLGRFCCSHWAPWGTFTLLAHSSKHRGRFRCSINKHQSEHFWVWALPEEFILLLFPGAGPFAGAVLICGIWVSCQLHKWCCRTDTSVWWAGVQWSWNDPPPKHGKLRELLSFLSYVWFFPVKTKVRSFLLKLTFLSLLNLLSHLPFLNMIDCSILKTATELFGSLRFWIVL